MKTQLTNPTRTKARYTADYKRDALELWRASGRSAAKVAAELGIRPRYSTGALLRHEQQQDGSRRRLVNMLKPLHGWWMSAATGF